MFDKNSLRIAHKARLKRQTNLAGTRAVLKAKKLIFSLIKGKKAPKVLLFAPLAYEPDILKLRRTLSTKAQLFLPFMLDKSLKIVKLRLPLKKDRFNVRQAMDSNAYIPHLDLALIPVIGVDVNMGRIGHGFGFYDRFFAGFKRLKTIIFISSQDLFVNAKVCDPHDIRGDFYISPKNIRTNYDRNHRSGGHWSHRRRGRLWSS